ncbi:MFS transporter [Paenibacillus sp. SYP-B4298]|uniref:MFS transporter n=1 Tax=Paenibacillus sp. SYP-B4298 TaxID=2996034 RepID=UPI0022DDF802|nr:MFS transporter [Paenibacillus sp. SYP-B4298]
MQSTKSRWPWVVVDHRQRSKNETTGESKPSSSGSSSKWKEYIALATVPLVLVLGNSMLVPILPDIERQLSISNFQSSLIITLFSVTAGLFIPIAGYLSDRFSRKSVILPSLAVYGAAGILAGFGAVWGSYTIVIWARALQGLGAAGTAPIAMALVGDMYKDGNESEALGLIEASNGAGKVVSPILGSLFALIIWYAPFFAFPFFCALSLLAMIWLIHEPKKKTQAPPVKYYLRQIGVIFREQGGWLIPSFFVGALALFILFGALFYLSDILEKPPYSIDGVAKGGILAIPLLGLVVTAYICGRKIKNNGPLMKRLMAIGLAAMTLALGAAILLYNQLYLLIGLLLLSSIGTGLVLPCLNTMIAGAVDRQHRGIIMSLYSSLRFLGVAFGPPLFGWLMGYSQLLLFSLITALAAISLILSLWRIHPPAKAGDTPSTA